MSDATYQPKTYRDTGGDRIKVASGGTLDIETGGILSFNGVDTTTALARVISGLAAGTRIAFGIWVTVAATDPVPTGLTTVTGALVSLVSSPVLGMQEASATTTGATTGSIIISGFASTATNDATPKGATTFGKGVAWFAWGT